MLRTILILIIVGVIVTILSTKIIERFENKKAE